MFKKFREKNYILFRILIVAVLLGQSIFYAHADPDAGSLTEPTETPTQEAIQETAKETEEEPTPTPTVDEQPEEPADADDDKEPSKTPAETPIPSPAEQLPQETPGETPTPSPTASVQPSAESEEEEEPSKKAEDETDMDEEIRNGAKDAIEYAPAGSFAGEIGDLFTIKAEYEAETFPLATMFTASSYMEPEKIAEAKAKMIELSGKTADEIVVRSIYGMDIGFTWYPKDSMDQISHPVKISLTRKDGAKLAADENYQLLHFNGTELEPVDLTVDEDDAIHFTSTSFSPFYLGVLGAPVPPAITGLTLPVDCAMLNAQGQDGEGVYHFPIHPGADGVFNITIPKEAFHGTNFRLSVDLPIGMVFDRGGLDNLKAKDEVLSVEYDANSLRSVVVTLKANPLTIDDLSTALAIHTGVERMSLTDLNDIITNGPKKTTLTFCLTDANGGLMGENKRYVVRPKTGSVETISVTSDFAATPAEISTSTDVNNSQVKANDFYQHLYPLVKLNIPEVDKDNGKLIRIKQVKVYRPVGLEDLCWPATLSIKDAFSSVRTYKKVTETPLTDSHGTYDVFEMSDEMIMDPFMMRRMEPAYNKTKQTEVWAEWKFKEDSTIPAETLFEAADTEIIFETEGQKEIVKTTGGVKMKTPKSVYDDRFKVVLKNRYKKGHAGIQLVIPGHSLFKQKFVDIDNRIYTQNYDANGDLIMSNGAYTETYHFPYEIQPFNYQLSMYYENSCKLGKMTLTIKKADQREIIKEIPKSLFTSGANISFAEYMEEGDRLKDLTLQWEYCKGPTEGTDDPFTIDYAIMRKHEDGSLLTSGELIKIGYEAEHKKKDGTYYRYNTDFDADYLYVQVGEETCNEFMESGEGGQHYIYQFGQSLKYPTSLGGIFMCGDEKSYKSLYKNPVITVKARANNINGIEEPISYMTAFNFSKRMAGWKIIYSSYNKVTAETKTDQEYTIPDTFNTPLTKADIGLAKDEYFTAIRLKYDGDWILEFVKNVDYTYNHMSTFRMVEFLFGVERDHSLYHDQEVDVAGAPTDRGEIAVDAFFKCDNPCSSNPPLGPDGIESTIYRQEISVPFKPKGEQWTISKRVFRADQQTVITYQGDIATASQSYTNGPIWDSGGAVGGAFLVKPKNLNTDEIIHACANIDVPETVYIELRDPEFDVASIQAKGSNESSFGPQRSVNGHEVSVVTANGKRYLKISSGDQPAHFSKNEYAGEVTLFYDIAKINLQAWNGAALGDHHPLGKVYYDISGMLTKYDGSFASGNIRYEFDGAVADTDDIRKTGDTTTPTLFEVGDMSAFTVRVLQHVLNGVQLYPGKNNLVDRQKPISFLPREKDTLQVSGQVHIPGSVSQADVIIQLPTKGETAIFTSFDAQGHEVSETKISQYTLRLKGQATSNHTSGLHTGDTVTYSYSMDGVNYVAESAISPSDWGNYRYIKMTLQHQAPGSEANIEVRVPCEAEEEPVEEEDLHAYVTGSYQFKSGTEILDAKCSSAEYLFHPYEVSGILWRDKNEDGVLDTGASIGENSGIIVQLKDTNGTEIGSTAGVGGKLNADGTFTIRTNHADVDYSVSLQLPSDMKMTKRTGAGDPTIVNTDSDFDRTTLITQAFHSFDTAGHAYNISGGLIKLPALPTKDQYIHIGETPKALVMQAVSENPDQPHPPITFASMSDPLADVDTAGVVTPKKTGVLEHLHMETSNTVGDVVQGEVKAIVYAKVVYKSTDSGVYGSAPIDAHRYYPSTSNDTDRVVVMGEGGLRRSGYHLRGWKDKNGHEYHKGDSFAMGEISEDVVLTAIWEKLPSRPMAKSSARPQVPDTGDKLYLHAYILLFVLSSGLAWASFHRLIKAGEAI